MKEFFFLIPEIFLLFLLLLLNLAYPFVIRTSSYYSHKNNKKSSGQLSTRFEFLATVVFGLIIVGSLLLITPVTEQLFLLQNQITLSPLTQVLKFFALMILASFLLINTFRVTFPYWEELLILTVYLALSMFFFMSANDFLFLWLSSEFQTFCFVFFLALNRNSLISIEVSLQFFIYSVFLSNIFLSGISSLYSFFGTINFNDLELLFSFGAIPFYSFDQYAFFSTIFCYFLFKFAIAPFHSWSIVTFEGTYLLLISFFTTVSKIAPFPAFLRLLFLFQSMLDNIGDIFVLLGLLSIAIGTFGGFIELNLKRFLAYSSINHFGWIFLCFAIPTVNAYLFAVLYFTLYLVISVSFLSFFYIAIPKFGNQLLTTFNTLSFLFSIDATLFISLIIILFSFVGIPPSLGFLQKTFVFYPLLQSELFVIPFVLIILSAMTAFNYLRILIATSIERNHNFMITLPLDLNVLIFHFSISILNITTILGLPSLFYVLYTLILTSF